MTFAKMTGFGFVTLLALAVAGQVDEEAPPFEGEVERFQAVRMSDSRVLVIDTTTGQCWSKYLRAGGWKDEGLPPRPGEQRREQTQNGEKTSDTAVVVVSRPPRLRLTDEPVELTIRQRGREKIPGSGGTLFIHLGDITEGQALVSLRNEAGQVFVGERSLAQGETLKFSVEGQPYVAVVKELRNLLTGDDFAVLQIAAVSSEKERRKTDAIEQSGNLDN